MIDTALNGKKVVKCDDCHMEIEHCGWMLSKSGVDEDGRAFRIVYDDRHYCDECAERYEGRSEFRICDECGCVMTEGFCDEFGDHVCEGCWDGFVAKHFPDGFEEVPEDEQEEYDDFYRAYDKERGEWYVTSWYWTQWD